MSFGFRPLVVNDCVGDRAIGPYNANLFDIEQKYASVMTRDQALAVIDRSGGLFVRTSGTRLTQPAFLTESLDLSEPAAPIDLT